MPYGAAKEGALKRRDRQRLGEGSERVHLTLTHV